MTAWLFVARRIPLLSRIPPREITGRIVEQAPRGDEVGDRGRNGLTALAHLAFGSVAGSGYTLLSPLLPPRVPPALSGAAYASAVWAASYLGFLPALGLQPSPARQSRGRHASMLVAHWIYGGVVGTLAARRR